MAGMQNMEAMLKSMLAAQESLAKQVGELAQKVTSMDQKMESIDQIPQLTATVNEMASRMRCMDWKSLRWRRVEWERIPPDMREMVVTFLSAVDNMSLNSAISHKKLRKQLKKSYKDAVIPGFDKHRFTDKGDFKGLRWLMKAGVALQRCELVLLEAEEDEVIENQGEVLRWLVDEGREDLAAVHGMRSSAKDVMKHSDWWGGEVSTLWLAASRGYADVVRGLMGEGQTSTRLMRRDAPP